MGRTARLAHSDGQSQRWIWFIVPTQGASQYNKGIYSLTHHLVLVSTLKLIWPTSILIQLQVSLWPRKTLQNTSSLPHPDVFCLLFLKLGRQDFHQQLMMIYLQLLMVRKPCLEVQTYIVRTIYVREIPKSCHDLQFCVLWFQYWKDQEICLRSY